MFLEFFRRELRGALSRPMIYIFTLIFALLAFGAVASDNVQIGGTIGLVHKNAPHVITVFVTVLSIFGLLFATAFCNSAALRDYQYQFDEILFSTPMGKSGYFFGRFLGAFLLSCIPFLGIFIGVRLASVIAPAVGWLNADRIGPMYIQTIINEYLIFILPNMFIGSAIIFWLAHRFKNVIISFVGAFTIIILYIISGTLLSDISNRTLAALLDTFGTRAYSVVSQYYSISDKNTLIPRFTGLLMQNRLIWIGVGLLITVLSYLNFTTRLRSRGIKKKRKKQKETKTAPRFSLPQHLTPHFGLKARWRQFRSIFTIDFKSIIKGPVFIILLIFCAVLVIVNLTQGYAYFGIKTYPLTYKMVDLISSNVNLFTLIILVFFSGELIWRNRTHHIDEVVNATPHSSLTGLIAHTTSLFSVAIIFHIVFIAFAILAQIFQGYFKIELGVYFGMFALNDLPVYAAYCCLFIFVQSILNNRYIGYFISVLLLFVLALVFNAFDIRTKLVDFASLPQMPYSDMNGFGPAVSATIWFAVYWVIFSILLLLVAGLFLHRRITSGFKERIKQARDNLTKKYIVSGLIVLSLWILCGGWIYYNTFSLNTFKTKDENQLLQVRYEQNYKHFENQPLPKIISADYTIRIYPEKRSFYASTQLKLKNETGQPIDSLLFSLNEEWNMKIDIPKAELIHNDDSLFFQIYRLKSPLKPGDSLPIQVKSHYKARGFENSVSNSSVLENGTFVNNSAILPQLGYDRNRELTDINDRKKYDLPPRKRAPDLVKDCREKCMKNYLSMGQSDWIPVTTEISTSSDQTAIAPGSLVKTWQKDGRNHYIYRVDKPSQNFYSFQSAKYKLAKKKWNGIDLEVYHSSKHPYNIDLMLTSLQQSLQYYTKEFGPYYHKEARIIEFPRYASFAQSFPGSMPYSESIGFILDLRDTTQNNVVQAVVAHEMAHQYWAHQEIPAFMQGSTMLTESFAEYSSLMVMKQNHSAIEMRNYLKYDYDRYLKGRSGEREKELPLYKVENQQYIHYGKGSVVLYALGQMIGTDSLNGALRTFLEKYKYKKPPYPNTYDFLKPLRKHTPDSLQYLIDDWIKKITFYDLRMEKARAQKTEADKYKVTMDISAKKYYADSLGHETKAPIDTWIDLGLFADNEEKELMFKKRVKIDQPKMSFTFTVDSLPKKAMIDPLRLYIEKIIDDNDKTVKVD